MNHLCFQIQTSEDLFNKLLEDYDEFKLNYLSSRIALNCAFTSWHLAEWIYYENIDSLKTKYSNLNAYTYVKKQICPSLQIMHDLANGTKHYSLTKHVPKVIDSNIHHGTFNNEDFNEDFNNSYLFVLFEDGSKYNFLNELEKVVNFWEEYFKKKSNFH